eukprot:Skav225588  [mRNA]  locus=scaffold901:123046:126986:+ [translate_table: standard]
MSAAADPAGAEPPSDHGLSVPSRSGSWGGEGSTSRNWVYCCPVMTYDGMMDGQYDRYSPPSQLGHARNVWNITPIRGSLVAADQRLARIRNFDGEVERLRPWNVCLDMERGREVQQYLWDDDSLGLDYVGATMTMDPAKSCMRDKAMWIDGETGFPFIDCFMRELKATGYCNHMGRETAGWFLIADLGLDWRMAAEWFESVLIPGEIST